MREPDDIPRRRRWPLILVVLVVATAGLWAGGWYFAAGKAQATFAQWREREAKSGRVFTCGSEAVGGFPFGFTFRCGEADVQLKSNVPPLAFKTKAITVSTQLWRPTVLDSEFIGPLIAADLSQNATMTASWRRAQAQVYGLPVAPERGTLTADEPVLDRTGAGPGPSPGPSPGGRVFLADRIAFDSRIVSGSARDQPVIETALKLSGAAFPAWHPAAAIPIDADITTVLRGLKDFAPKPWQQRLRELQAAGGNIEFTKARVQQDETIAVASGTLGLSPAGRLHGQLRLTVANLEKFLPKLGLDKMLAPQAAPPQLDKAFGALDRLMPGLGNVARQNAGPAIVAGINIMGERTELEGKRAVIVPLRFNDGAVSLGPIPIGTIPPLY